MLNYYHCWQKKKKNSKKEKFYIRQNRRSIDFLLPLHREWLEEDPRMRGEGRYSESVARRENPVIDRLSVVIDPQQSNIVDRRVNESHGRDVIVVDRTYYRRPIVRIHLLTKNT